MTDTERDAAYEVIWDGGEGLVAPRETKIIGIWVPPPRLYNKTGNHTKAAKEAKRLEKETQDDPEDSIEPRIYDPLNDDDF